jgi:dipeptidyl aminopeptidase/acylaminoacyl peptidase
MHSSARRNYLIPVVLLLVAWAPHLLAQEAATATPEAMAVAVPDPVLVDEILVTDIIPLQLPAFHDTERAGVTTDDLFQQAVAVPGDGWPCENCDFSGSAGRTHSWKKVATDAGRVTFATPATGTGVRYLAFAITSDRWQKATLTVAGAHPVSGVLDGADLALTKSEAADDEPAGFTAEMTLTIGKHLVVLRTMPAAEATAPWDLGLSVTPAAAAGPASLVLDTASTRPVDIQLVLDAPRIADVSVSPDGKLAAISLGAYRNGKDREQWLEIRRTDDGALVHLWRNGQAPAAVTWHPAGRQLSWQTSHDGAATIWLHDLESGNVTAVLEDVEKLGRWNWAPAGGSIVYQINRSPDPDPRKVKRVQHPADRQPWWRDRSHLMEVFVPGGLTRRLTAGPVSADGWTISPDGKQLLFFTNEPDITNRPFSTTELWLMDLETLATTMVLDDPWVGGADFSPDGKTLLLQASPSAFDGLGRNLPAGVQANDYGGQLYLFDLETGRPTAITVDLRPDISGAAWSVADGYIYARTIDTQYNTVYRFKPGQDRWERINTGLEVTSQFALARDAHVAVARGSGATRPNRLYTVDLKKNKATLLLDPGQRQYADIVFGKVEDWVATLPDGMKLDGFVYYPPGFDPALKYPVIVYYYGGTSPITRDFGGRYPKNVWAGQGYVVYVPNPSGATGYGQEYAARHVNDWGKLTAAEVIAGTKAFLAAHEFADPERVGCMGASYGGFLTEYVVTRTDIFAAAVSHAGISDISSYWGEGLWGYAYGARALADSYPWQNRDLFVEQSALFHADKITTPLLLVHGDGDTNVPKGESDQLFTALKILGREVEYVQILGQDHHILDHDQRIVWNDTILAFLAKHLKGRPAWWEAMYPEPTDYR